MIVLANKQPIDVGERRFTCLVHQHGVRVDVPEAVEINSRNTVDCMAKMTQKQWEHISTGQLFRILFATIFPKEDYTDRVPPEDPDSNFPKPQTRFTIQMPSVSEAGGFVTETIDTEGGIPVPKTIEELNEGDFGIIHAAGMIVLGCEAIFEGKLKIFFRNPEDTLHPKAERRIVHMMQQMMYLAGVTGTATEETPTIGKATEGIATALPDLPTEEEPKKPKKPRKKK